MLTKTITSLQHPLVKEWEALRKTRALREKEGKVLIVGRRMVQEFPFSIQTLIVLAPSAEIVAREQVVVSEAILRKITGLEESDGFAAIVDLPQPQDLANKKYLLVADQISDPGNLGTLVRTALGLGWEGIVATPGTVDFFNDKALRAAKGATFRLPFAWKTPEEIEAWFKKEKIHPFVADLSGTSLSQVSFAPPVVLILSHEAKGPLSWAKGIGKKISIPMEQGVDSLNVAIAGAILLYAMRPL